MGDAGACAGGADGERSGSITPTTVGNNRGLYREQSLKILGDELKKRKNKLQKERTIINQIKGMMVGTLESIFSSFVKQQHDDCIKQLAKLDEQLKKLSEFIEQAESLMTNSIVVNLIEYQDGVTAAPPARAGPVVKRCSLEHVKYDQIAAINPSDKYIHILEMAVFFQAFNLLRNQEQENRTKHDRYLNNVVVVDMIDRVAYKKAHDATDPIPMHSVCLYKVPNKDEFLIIDPNSTAFSAFIANNLRELLGISVTSKVIKGDKIYDRSVGTSVGTRDCIDICVKLGFEINEQQAGNQRPIEIGLHGNYVDLAICYITNQKSVVPPLLVSPLTLLHTTKKDLPVAKSEPLNDRCRQSSRAAVRNNANRLLIP